MININRYYEKYLKIIKFKKMKIYNHIMIIIVKVIILVLLLIRNNKEREFN